ncbi:MAG TPA: hypothetical protein VGO86_05160 [Candidatus Dormibacteraeota bacterium]
MSRILGLVLAGLLAIGVIVAVGVSLSGNLAPRSTTTVQGVIGSEKQSFFQDAGVQAVFRRNGLTVKVDTAGSREMATSVDLSRYDFAFPAGVQTALKIKKDRKASTTYEPFSTPMAIATFRPIAQLLVANHVASDAGGYYTFDMQAYLALVARNARWTDLAGNTAYPAGKSVLVTSTDVRTSNSAAMYLSVASYVANGGNVVADDATARRIVPQVAPIFLRQGFTASSTDEPFQDYLSIGIGKTPLVMVYEAQFLALEAAHDRALTPDMVLMYPNPTVLSKHTLVPLKPAGDRVGSLLRSDRDLQRLAARYGFHPSDPAVFTAYLKERGVPQPPQLVNVIEPPAFEQLETMINGIDQLTRGGG